MERVGFDVFRKLDLRVGKIISVEDHPNADKLFILRVDLGEPEERQIIAGLRGRYKKEQLVGKKAIFVVNLEPAMLRGFESDGMILAACSDDKDRVFVLTPDKDIEVGSKIS